MVLTSKIINIFANGYGALLPARQRQDSGPAQYPVSHAKGNLPDVRYIKNRQNH